MLSLVPAWRADAQRARRLFGLSDDLAEEDVVRAAEQLRYQAHGRAELPLWLQALAGFASADGDQVQWFEDSDERAVLLALISRIDSAAPQKVLVFAGAAELQKRLRLRCLLAGLSPSFAADWADRFRDGAAWQPQALGEEPEAAAAILQLATGQDAYAPLDGVLSRAQAEAQALALLELNQRGWL